jgi:choline kinase
VNAIILAAGLGSRLAPLTDGRPKCLLPLHDRTILEWQLALVASCGLERVTIAVGYREAAIRAVAGARVEYATCPRYAETNNLHTLQHCGHLLDADLMILFADVLVTRDSFARCAASASDCALLVDTAQRRPDTMRVRLVNGAVEDIGAHVTVAEADGNFVGIAKFSTRGATRLRRELDRLVLEGGFEGAYYTHALPRLAASGITIDVVPTGDDAWCEIDDQDDYRRAAAESFYIMR